MKIDYTDLYPLLKNTALEPWIEQLPERIARGLRHERHGHLPEWEAVLAALPLVEATSPSLTRRSDVPVAYTATTPHPTNFFDPKEQTAHLVGNLPHWRQDGCLYFVTFRLADSLPSGKLNDLRIEKETWLKQHPEPSRDSPDHSGWQREYKTRFQDRIEKWLDAGHGRCILRPPEIRRVVEQALHHFDGDHYRIDSFVVMPNHVHVLVAPLKQYTLSDIVKAWKSYTAHVLVSRFGIAAPVWQKEYFDHIVRSPEHLEKFRTYIIDNPKRLARLCDEAVASTKSPLVEATSPSLNSTCDEDVASTKSPLVEATSPSLARKSDVPVASKNNASTNSTIELKHEVRIDGPEIDGLADQLKVFHPWRKGPFHLHGIHIDTEWRSDWKWDRVLPHLQPLEGRAILDVGCGNGYHCWRMLGEGARLAIGIDPSLGFVCQFFAMQHFIRDSRAWVLPLGIEDLPPAPGAFDTVFSMGVLYHRKSPIEHIEQLCSFLRPGGELVIETLVVDGPEGYSLIPHDRYAKMRNVWFIPSVPTLELWLKRCGLKNIRTVDRCATSTEEQRSTDWMTYESLPDFLDPADASKTIEGHPAPQRAVIIADA